MMLTGTQCRMARAALKWGVQELADISGINKNTIVRFESGEGSHTGTVEKLLEAFSDNGVTFNENGCVCPPAQTKPKKK